MLKTRQVTGPHCLLQSLRQSIWEFGIVEDVLDNLYQVMSVNRLYYTESYISHVIGR